MITEIRDQAAKDERKRAQKRESERKRNKARQPELNRRKYQFELDHPTWYLCKKAKCRAKKHGIPFGITREDIKIPENCPILGIPLKRNLKVVGPDSPTLDRIVPEKGYVLGNIAVISHKANAIKQNATAEEILRVAIWLKQNCPG